LRTMLVCLAFEVALEKKSHGVKCGERGGHARRQLAREAFL
jgi:hypothetical protein